jgi:hypothetical protein
MEKYLASSRDNLPEKHFDWLSHNLTRSRSYIKSTVRGNVATLNHRHLNRQVTKCLPTFVARQHLTMIIWKIKIWICW